MLSPPLLGYKEGSWQPIQLQTTSPQYHLIENYWLSQNYYCI